MKQQLKTWVMGAALLGVIPALAADAPAGSSVGNGESQPLPLLVWPENQALKRVREQLGLPGARSSEESQRRLAAQQSRVDLVVQAFMKDAPEVFQGPERTGIHAVALLLRPDGSVFRSRKVLVPDEQLPVVVTQSFFRGDSALAWIPFFPIFTDSVGNLLSWVRGTALADGKVLRTDVALSYQYLPAGYDEAHSALRVWEAVAAKHADLLRPAAKPDIESNGKFNWLVVLMNEDGTIARVQAETVQSAERLEAGRVGPSSFNLVARQFKVLGLEPAQLGEMGFMRVNVLPDGTLATSPRIRPTPMTANAQYRDLLESRELMVSFAWSRRPGEPAGGVSGHSLAQQNADLPLDPAITLAIVERYFPGEFVAADQPIERRPWVLLSQQGEVLRTGVVPNTFTVTSEAGRPFALPGSNYWLIQNALPGVKFGVQPAGSSLVSGAIETQVLDRAGRQAVVRFLWLAPGSPLPRG